MTREELAKKVSDIADIGIVNAKKDVGALREAAGALRESDLDTIRRIFAGCEAWKDKTAVIPDGYDGSTSMVIWEFRESVTLIFDKDGRLVK